MLNMWRDTAAGGPATAWASPTRPSQQATLAASPNQAPATATGLPGQSTLLQVAVQQPSSLQHHTPTTQQVQQHGNHPPAQHNNQMTGTVGGRGGSMGGANGNHPQQPSRSAEMNLMLAENLAESVLNHQNTTVPPHNNGASVNSKQITVAAVVAAGAGGGLEKSIGRLSLVSNVYVQ